jgi:hypothetical protein
VVRRPSFELELSSAPAPSVVRRPSLSDSDAPLAAATAVDAATATAPVLPPPHVAIPVDESVISPLQSNQHA